MNNTVGLCKTNINAALNKLKHTCETLSQKEETNKILKRKEMIE